MVPIQNRRFTGDVTNIAISASWNATDSELKVYRRCDEYRIICLQECCRFRIGGLPTGVVMEAHLLPLGIIPIQNRRFIEDVTNIAPASSGNATDSDSEVYRRCDEYRIICLRE